MLNLFPKSLRTSLSLPLLPAVGLAGLTAAYLCGCGGGGTNPVSAAPQTQHGWGESQLKDGSVRIGADSVVALALEPRGTSGEEDTGGDGEDRIPYRLDEPTRLTVEMKPEDPMYITLIASATGKLVFEVGPENPKVEMELPAGDYDLYVHSTSSETQTIFAKGQAGAPTRANYRQFMLLIESGSCAECDLSGARFYGLELRNGNLAGANLARAVFERCVLDGTNLNGASLEKAQVRYTQAKGVKLTNANLFDTVFLEVNLSGSTLTDAALNDAHWTDVVANNVTGHGLRAMDATFERVDFRQSDLQSMQLWSSTLKGSNFAGANLDRVTMSDLSVENGSFRGTQQNGALWQRAVVKTSDFTGANLHNVGFSGSFTDSKFNDVYAVYARFGSTKFLRTSFVNADVQRASFANAADLGMNDFTGAILSNTVWFTGRTCAQGSIGLCR